MKILVTGGSGFIGSHLCNMLISSGHEVVCMDNLFTSRRSNLVRVMDHSRFEFWRHDVCDPWHLECDQIYHLACPASPVHYKRNPVRTIKTAVLGTLNALECARNAGARILIASTSEVYGDPAVHPQREDYYGHVNPIGDRACYDEGKRAGESLAASWSMQYGTDVRIARVFNSYGQNMTFDDGRMIPNFILQALSGQPLTIYGDGLQTRSWCYVSDTVRGLISLMELDKVHAKPCVMNIGNPDERTVLDIARLISKIAAPEPGLSPTFSFQDLTQDDPKQRCPDITLARDLLGWSPEVGLEDGLSRTVGWFRDPTVHGIRIMEP